MIKTHCKNGHALTKDNLVLRKNGYAQCRVCFNKSAKECTKRWRTRHPDKAKYSKLKYRYGVTPEQYETMYEQQEGKCILPSCGRPINATNHDHVSGLLRGLMCKEHNIALGLFSDSPKLLREAAEYLERFIYGR